MKRFLIAIMGAAVFAALAGTGCAQRNPRGTAKLSVNGKAISVDYGRPSLKGRNVGDMLGQLQPGDVWRLGADKSTTFSTSGDLAFGSVTVPAGEYSLWARRESGNTWSLVFNKQHGQWGTQHDAAQDLAAAPMKESKPANSEEMVTIALAKEGAGGVITVQWGDMKLSANFQAK